ncbi:hypothetical protein [Eilatimonas milleporae]|uniref:hypothetical protein n=1 Tax=Eilatimonas milleporae TaxID=911205 RepID=UPI0011C390C1|nr:hypothetical protein [Eilatimonas milleporae]
MKQRVGEEEHARYHAQLKQSGIDRRCFIATAVFGLETPEIHVLRRFRSVIESPFKAQETLSTFANQVHYRVARDFVLGRFLLKKGIQQAGNRNIYGPGAGEIILHRR